MNQKLNFKEEGHLITGEIVRNNGTTTRTHTLAHGNIIESSVVIKDSFNMNLVDIGYASIQSITPKPDKPWIYDITINSSSHSSQDLYIEYMSKGDTIDADDFNEVNNAVSSIGKIGDSRLVASYRHTGNPEYHIQSIDWNTCIATLKEPHGISTYKTVLMCPNFKDLPIITRDIKTMPEEWLSANIKIGLHRVSDTEVKIAKDTDISIVYPVNVSSSNNSNVDITKFHFESPAPYSIKGLPKLKRMRIVTIGYLQNQYRYEKLSYYKSDNSIDYTGQYLNRLGFPNPGPVGIPTNGLFTVGEQILEYIEGEVFWHYNSRFHGARNGYGSYIENGSEEKVFFARLRGAPDFNGFEGIETYGSSYAHLANGSYINIYDLGGY